MVSVAEGSGQHHLWLWQWDGGEVGMLFSLS